MIHVQPARFQQKASTSINIVSSRNIKMKSYTSPFPEEFKPSSFLLQARCPWGIGPGIVFTLA
jgi:hypothetical protein